jgi:hypothetical protein
MGILFLLSVSLAAAIYTVQALTGGDGRRRERNQQEQADHGTSHG